MKTRQNNNKDVTGDVVLPHVLPSAFIDYRDWILALHENAQKSSPKSWLDLAHDLGLSRSNALFLVARGKRPLSNKAAQKIAAALALNVQESQWLRILVEWQNCTDLQKREDLFRKILDFRKEKSENGRTQLHLEYFSAWWHPALRERVNHRPLVHDPERIAKEMQPRLRPEQVVRSLELLQKLGLIQREGNFWVSVSAADVSTGANVDSLTESLGIIRYHREAMNLAKDSLTHVSEDLRDVSAVTICVSAATAERMKSEIAALRARLLAMAAAENQQEAHSTKPFAVWQFNAQLFPLTQLIHAHEGDPGQEKDTDSEKRGLSA